MSGLPALKIVWPDGVERDKRKGHSGVPSRAERKRRRRWTLRELFENHFRFHVLSRGKRSADDIGFYFSAVSRWEEAWESPGPALEDVEAELANELDDGDSPTNAFVARLAKLTWRGRPISEATIRRHCRYVQMILDSAGPDRRHGRRLKRGAYALRRTEIPYLTPAGDSEEEAKPSYTLDELWRWIRLVQREPGEAPWTAPIPASEWYAALLAFLHNTGARPELALGATWPMLHGDWLHAPKDILKGKRRGLKLYLNRFAREAIDRIRVYGQERIFPWRGWPGTAPRFYEVCRDQLARANLPQYGYRGIRRLFSTSVSRRNPLVAAWMLGHRQPPGLQILARHYAGRETLIREEMDRYSQPGPGRQLELF